MIGHFAAHDGTMVWGVGRTGPEALKNAKRMERFNFAIKELRVSPCTPQLALAVRSLHPYGALAVQRLPEPDGRLCTLQESEGGA